MALAADLAEAVGALVELGQRPLDVVELVAQVAGQRLVLALLGRHLAAVGEVVVLGLGQIVGVQLAELGSRSWLCLGPRAPHGRRRRSSWAGWHCRSSVTQASASAAAAPVARGWAAS